MKKTILPAAVAIAMATVGRLEAEPVTWTGAVGVTVSGNSLTRGAAAAAWNAGAASVQVVRDGYGFVEFTATETNTQRMCGLSRGDTNQANTDVDFALNLTATGGLQVVHNGGTATNVGSYATGDRLRVEIAYGVVRYLRNGTVVSTSTVAPTFPLRVDTSLYTPGATLSDVRVGNLVWSGATAVTIVDRTLTATGATGWNSGAASANLVGSGDGYVEFTAGQNTTSRAAGLANGNAGTTLADIEYAIHLRADGMASVVESGTSRGDFGGYVGSDRFRVEVSGGAVRYLKNGALFYTSTVAPAYPLRADTAFETTGSVLQDFLVEALVWSSEVGAVANGASLVKTAPSGWNAGAASTDTIGSGDGWVEFTAIETSTRRVLGLESGPASTTWSDIDYAIELTETGQVNVHESGTLRGTFGTYAHADLFRIEIREGVVRYRKNGGLLYTSTVAPAYPLHADASLYTSGATLVEVAMGDLVWLNEQNVEVRGTLLRKSDAGNSWGTSGAVSTRAIGAGYVEFVASATNHARMLGLSHGDTTVSYTDIDYAIYLQSNGTVGVYENGTSRGSFGSYATGDRLRVELQGGVVRYRRNDALLYTSAVAPALPLRVDVAMNTAGSTFMDEVHVGTAVEDQLDPPVLAPATNTYTVAQNVSMTAFHGAAIRYTTDGSEPNESSTLYTGLVPVNTYTVLKARAFKTGFTPSNTAPATYSFNYGTLAAPTLTAAGTYITSVDVSMSAGAGTTIRYTTDGSNVLDTSPVFTAPVTIDATKTVKARAFMTDWTASATTSVTYTIKVATPVISLGSGTYAAGAPITVAVPTPGATAHYTTSGIDPANPATNEVAIASGGSLFAGNYTLKVRSYKTGLTASDVASATYTVTGSLSSGDVASGGDYSLAVLPDGQLWGWGASPYAQTGSGVGIAGGYPQPIVGIGLTGIVKAAGGKDFTLALRTDGRFYVFGFGGYGQMGLGDLANRYTPTLHPLTSVTAVAAGEHHALALRSDGTVWAWGANASGQLGFGPDPAPPPATNVVSTPGQVEGLEGRTIVAVAAGDQHSVALDSEGNVWAWGLNSSYQLGDGTTTQRNRPVRVEGLFGIVAIGSGPGANHTLAVRGGDRAVLAWGQNDYGQLGDGSATVRAAPVKVFGLTGIASVASNRFISTAVGQDGRLWSWGTAAQVGNGSTGGTTQQTVPVVLEEPSGVIQSSAGNGGSSGHALALSNDGVIWSWGYNSNHQIGDGMGFALNRYRPVRVTEPGFARKVATPYPTGAGPSSYPSPVSIGFASYTAGAAIHYTTDGSEPTTSSPLFTGSFQVAQNTSFKVKAFKDGLAPSNTPVYDYEFEAATPTFTPAGGTYTTPQTVAISTTTVDASIRYTTDGSVPTDTSPVYATPLALSADTTLKAKAFHPSMNASGVATAGYTFNFPSGAAPAFTPAAGTHVGLVAVSINGPAGATLRYTVDGSEPTATSTIYSAPITIATTTTLKAKSFEAAQAPSPTTSGLYTIELAAPSFVPAGGAVPPGHAVALNHPVPEATIRYTIDGADPTPTSPGVTPGSTVTIHTNLTLKARAYQAGTNPSAVVSAAYTVSGTASGAGFIAAGNAFTLLSRPDGTVWAWGQNPYGQLGDGSNVERLSPTPIASVSGVTWLGAGGNHSVARKSDGTPWTTGLDSAGQLGNGTDPERNTFGALAKPGGIDVVAVAAKANHTLSLGADGNVWAWGLNTFGQLGNGNNTSQAQPVPVGGLTNVQAVAAGGHHSLAVKTDGTVWAWGRNTSGQLGTGGTTASNVPVQVKKDATTPLTNITTVAAGGEFSLALASDGTVWSWGRNAEGQLGSGATSVQRNYAGGVVQLAQIRAIAAGEGFGLAVRQDGTVWAWGYNGAGQLGDGTGSTRPTPVQALGVTGIDSVAAGGLFSVALGVDGSVWAWGSNSSGQLGDGTTTGRSTPARVSDAGFSWRVGTPQFNPPNGSHSSVQNVIITSTTPGATIHYTKTGVEPTQGDPSIPSGGVVVVDESLTLKARAYKSGWSPSAVATLPFSLTVPPPTVTPAAGTYHVPFDVIVSHDMPGVVIRYTTDGSPVLPTSPVLTLSFANPLSGTAGASAGLHTNAHGNYRFQAFRGASGGGGGGGGGGSSAGVAWAPSSTVSRNMRMKVGKPGHGPSSGVFSSSQSVGVGSVTPNARLFGATGQRRSHSSAGGSAALHIGTTGSSGGQAGTALIGSSTTLRTFGERGVGWDNSDNQSASYFIARGALAPTSFALGPVTLHGQYLRILPDPVSPASTRLRYTLDGSEPTWRSPLYRGPIRVRPGMQFRGRAFNSDHSPSPSSIFGVPAPPGPENPTSAAEPPAFSPPGGTYMTRRTVTLTTATPGASIRYTTDGTEPNASSPTVPSGGTVVVTRGLPLKAQAVASGMSDSPVSRADYRITGAVAGSVLDTYNNEQSAMALKTDGTLWGWGSNAYGELGTGTTTLQTTPVQVSGLTDVVAFALGMTHGLAVRSNGTVWAWGQNDKGQLGDGTTGDHLTPAVIPTLSNIVAVTATIDSSYALSATGAVYAWGSNAFGKLGIDDDDPYRTSPAAVGIGDVADIKAGWHHVLALKRDGTVWSWGYNGSGSLGDNTLDSRDEPVQVTGLLGVVSIAASGNQSLASKSDGNELGQIWAWGAGNDALGDDMQSDQAVPVHVFEGAKAAFMGDQLWSAYIKPGAGGLSELWASGRHYGADLHTGNLTTSSIPVPLATGSFVEVGGTASALMALRWDGTLLHWGANFQSLNGFALGDASWANTDHDGDGLKTAQEWDIGTDPWNADSNEDGITDGHAVAANLDPFDTDVDRDGLANALERATGTDAFRADTDGDGHPDGEDAYPLDPTRWEGPPANSGDTTAPLVTLTEPTNATLVSVVPAP